MDIKAGELILQVPIGSGPSMSTFMEEPLIAEIKKKGLLNKIAGPID